MRTKNAFLAVLVFTLVSPNPAPAKNVTSKKRLSQTALHAAGIYTVLKQLPQNLNQAMNGQKGKLPPKIFAGLKRDLMSAFSVRKIRVQLDQHVTHGTKRAALVKAVRWFRSPLGKKILAAERESNTPQGKKKFQAWMATLSTKPPSKQRATMTGKILGASGGMHMATSLTLALTRGILRGSNSRLPKDQQMSEQKIAQVVKQAKSKLEEGLKQNLILSALFAYRNLPLKSMQKYLNYLQSKDGNQFIVSVVQGLDQSLALASNQVGRVIAAKGSEG